MNAILRLGDYPPAERVTRLAIMLNALDDENVCLVLKRALQAVPLKILAGIYNTSVYQCTIGVEQHNPPHLNRTVVGLFLSNLKLSTLTTAEQVRRMGMKPPPGKL